MKSVCHVMCALALAFVALSAQPAGRRAESTFNSRPAAADQLAAQHPVPVIDPNQKFRPWPARACNSAPLPGGVYLTEYMRLGGPNGPMGCPIQQVVSIPGVAHGGRAQFQNGTIVTNDDVWPGGVLAAYQDGSSIVVDWAVQFGNFNPRFHYSKFVVRWRDLTDRSGNANQTDVPFHVDQPDWTDTNLGSQGSWAIPWNGSKSSMLAVTVEGCDNPSNDILKPDPLNSRCLQGWMPEAPVAYTTNASTLPGNDFLFIDFNRNHIAAPGTEADSRASFRARAAAAIVQSACSTLPYSAYRNEESYRVGIHAKMMYADYFSTDRCPGRTANNRDEVNESLRNQSVPSGQNTGSTFDGISLERVIGDAANICGPHHYDGSIAPCPPYRKGEYDVVLVAYAALLSKYGRQLAPDVYHHVLHDLLTKKGPFNSSDLTVNVSGIVGPETENHTLQIEVSQYLTNQMMYAETRDPRYNNATNGMNQFFAGFLQDLLRRDFLEYNARPYQDYSLPALEFLYSFANDVNDAPAGGISSHAVKLAALMVLDYESAKVAVSTDDGRRASPYRRKVKTDNDPGGHDLIGAKGDAQFPRMLLLAGTGINQLADPAPGLAINNYSLQMVHAAFSSYRVPEFILDELLNRVGRKTYASFHHSADEVYWRSSSYIISAGGHPAPTLYPFHADSGTIAALGGAVTAATRGLASGVIASAIAGQISHGDEDARGVALPTTFMPAGRVTNRDDLLRFEGFGGHDAVNMCVAPNFACGAALQIPGSFYRQGCWESRAGNAPQSKWIFFNFTGACGSPQTNVGALGYYLAVWYQMSGAGSNQRADGFLEAYERDGPTRLTDRLSDRPPMGRLEPMAGGGALQAKQPARTRGGASNTPLRDRVAEQPRLDVQPVAPDAALGALTFGEFVKAVLARNGNKNFTTGHNDGPNAYTTLEGQQIGFDIGNGIVIRPMPQKLVDGDFLSSDVPGRITIRGYRNGETLVLDDTHPAAPVYSFRHDLRYNKFDNERLRDPMMKP